MNSKGQGKGAIVGLAAVILIAGYFIFRQAAPKRYTAPHTDWVCESCDNRFIAPVRMETRSCPECRGDAVRSYIFYDTAKEELVEIFREKPHPDFDPETMRYASERMIKAPGGEWRVVSEEDRALYRGFPFRVERPDDLRSAPPGSEYRE